VTDGADVTKWPACAGAAPNHYADTIQNNGFWSRWRRDGDGPRSLEHLLKQVEKGTQVRSSGADRVLAELKQHRDDAPDGDLRSALTWLCNAQTRLGADPTTAHSREVLLAAYEVKRVLATAGPTPR
jgi:hypothetical protein